MRSTELCDALRREVERRGDLSWREWELEHRAGRYRFPRIASQRIGPHDRVVLLRAGVHGDERAGPLTLLRDLGAIAERVHRRGLKLVAYPLANPSGFDAGTRYNADGDRGDCGNNSFLYYELADGTLRDDLGRGRSFRRWYWASDRRLRRRLPAETALLHERLKEEPLRRVVAVLDLHQDHLSPQPSPGAYHYGFGDLERFRPVLERLQPMIPILRRRAIGAGQASAMRTGGDGFIVRHDGTLCDLFDRLGAPFALTPETLGATPLDLACRVNRVWVDGVVDLAAAPGADRVRDFDREVRRRLEALAAPCRTSWAGTLPVVVADAAPAGAPRVLLTAGLHGDEPAGVLGLLEFLERDLARYAGRFSFLVLPCVNPSGFERGIRPGAAGVDVNRCFGEQGGAPEAEVVKRLLGECPGPYALALDLHETDTYVPPGGGFGVEDNPASFYLYEQGSAGIGRPMLDRLRGDGVPITRRTSVYGAACEDGLISAPAPGHPDHPDRPEFVGTMDWHLLGRGFTDRFLATETPTAWLLRRRVAVQRRAIRLALDRLLRESRTASP